MSHPNSLERELRESFFEVIKPRTVLSVSECADKFRHLSPESSQQPGLWRTSYFPYTKEPMDAFNRDDVREIVLMWAAQCAKTEVLMNQWLWTVLFRPGATMFVYPGKEMAETDFSTIRLEPMIRDSPELRKNFYTSKSIQNKKTNKTYRGGYIRVVSTSKDELISRPTKYVFFDELSNTTSNSNALGDIYAQGVKRTENFYDAKIVAASTPDEESTCRTYRLWQNSRQHLYFAKCPYCKDMIELKFDHLKWDEDKPETARYECQSCRKSLNDRDKVKAVSNGHWVCVTPDRAPYRMGYHINSIYSPALTFERVVRAYIEARGSQSEIKTYWNTFLGLPSKEDKNSVDFNSVYFRREDYGGYDMPEGALVLTAGVDVNGWGLAVEICAWGKGEESWSVDYSVFHGDPLQDQVWRDLKDHLLKRWTHPWGITLKVEKVCVDTGGHWLTKVTDFIYQNNPGWILGVKGMGGPGRPIVGPIAKSRTGIGARRLPLHLIGTDEAKTLVYSRLSQEVAGPGYCHFPKADAYNAQYFRELTCEKFVTKPNKQGFAEKKWIKPDHIKNEPLDVRVYNLAAIRRRNPNYDEIEKRLSRLREEIYKEIEQGSDEEPEKIQAEIERAARAKKKERRAPDDKFKHIFKEDVTGQRSQRRRNDKGWFNV